MDCNKEEALKSKGIAEKKMLCRDFTGARKLALRAQQLCPDLENISQMLVVCEVHCSAEKRLSGNEMDWYSILQIEQTANEATIKKQYRKFALQLHPDKNKFAGAEAAFKLIGEAQKVLLDQNKRSLYDMKRMASIAKVSVTHRPLQKTSWNSNVGFQNNFRTNFSGLNPQYQQPQQQGHAGLDGGLTFWTVCPFCSVKFEYYKEMIHRSLRCQKCDKPFIAYDMNMQAAQFAPSLNLKTYFQKDILNQGASKAATGHQGNTHSDKHRTVSFRKTDYSSKVASDKVTDKIRRKRAVESSENSDTGSGSDSYTDMVIDEDGDIHGGMGFGSLGEQPVRRSTRNRQQVSYKEKLSDDDELVRSPKKAKRGPSLYPSDKKDGVASEKEGSKMNKQPGFTDEMKNGSAERHGDEKAKSDSTELEPELYDYPDPDFSDFDRDRQAECFKVGQTWALYDTVDAMPRFYAQIMEVFDPGFEVRMTWLEPDPEDRDEIEWVNKDLPVSCGKFILGNSEDTKDRPMFSHLVPCVMESRKGSCRIYPRKGETWALFRNWDLKQWSSAADAHRQYEYDFVVILSDYAKDVGVSVGLLVKLKGFSCLFGRKAYAGKETFKIPARELFRFSHRVPSFQMTGDEREGVPKGSFELDPAALPNNYDEFDVPENIKGEDGITHYEFLCSVSSSDKAHSGPNGNAAIHQV